MSDEALTGQAQGWALDIGEALAELVPEPFTFVLAIFEADNPKGSLMLSPQHPSIVSPILRTLADTIDAREHEIFTREGSEH